MSKLIAWIFMPTVEDESRSWPAALQKPATPGEVRFRDENDVAMSNEQFFQPGWKRAPWLDEK